MFSVDTSVFVQDVFDAIANKSYAPNAVKPTIPSVSSFAPPAGPASGQYASLPTGVPRGPRDSNQTRKRSYNEREGSESRDGRDTHYSRNERAFKQPRRASQGSGNLGRGG